MRYGSVCSGIEAATVAWEPLGWTPAWFSEIEDFPCRVLAHHYPTVPNLGDMTTLAERVLAGEVEAPDVLVGGVPCQPFSVAGLRKGLADHRNLTVAFVELLDAIDLVRVRAGKPHCWGLIENVPGLLTSDDNALGALLGGLVGSESPIVAPAGWTGAGVVRGPARVAVWRILDAQFFGVAQRRRRWFCLTRGGPRAWAAADALLPLTPSLLWNSAPRGKAGTRVARAPAGGAHFGRSDVPDVAGTLGAHASGGFDAGDLERSGAIIPEPLAFDWKKGGDATTRLHATPEAPTLSAGGPHAVLTPDVVPALTSKMAKGTGGPSGDECQNLVLQDVGAKESGQNGLGVSSADVAYTVDTTGRQGVATPIAFSAKDHGADAGDLAPTLRAGGFTTSHANGGVMPAVCQPIAFDTTQITHPENRSRCEPGAPAPALATTGHAPAIAFAPDVMPPLSPGHGGGSGHQNRQDGQEDAVVAFSVVPEGGQGADLRAAQVDIAPALTTEEAKTQDRGVRIATAMAVRRLTPRECERLQAFPDDYTAIPGAADGPRYRALGNSMCVKVMAHLGRAIQRVERG